MRALQSCALCNCPISTVNSRARTATITVVGDRKPRWHPLVAQLPTPHAFPLASLSQECCSLLPHSWFSVRPDRGLLLALPARVQSVPAGALQGRTPRSEAGSDAADPDRREPERARVNGFYGANFGVVYFDVAEQIAV